MNLTPKQEKFCQLFVELGNASEAYRHSYNAENMSNESVKVEASNLLKHKKIKPRVEQLRKQLSDFNLENNSIKIDLDLYELIKSHFESDHDAKKWISFEIAKAASKIGIDVTKNRASINGNTRYSVLHRAGFKCQACGLKPNPDNNVVLHIDHIIPYSYGGSNNMDNLQVLCSQCNISKSNRFSIDHNCE